MITKKIISLALGSLASLALLSSCGGSGGGSAEPGEYLPVGSTLNLNMNNGSNAIPYLMSVTATGNNMGTLLWQSKTSGSGSIGYTFVKEGNQATFKTSFTYIEGSYIRPGPIIVSPYVTATIMAVIDLPEDISSDSFKKQISGSCSYTVVTDPGALANEPSGTFTGTGIYSIDPTVNY